MTTADIGSLTRSLAHHRAEVFARAIADGDVELQEPTEWTGRPHVDEKAPTAEQVAKVIAGISVIGHARNLLEQEGYTATIVAQRITVNLEVVAQFVSCNGHAWWQVYATDGTPPIWTVGAQGRDPGDWRGCVE